ncbi:MAG: PLP-dependent aminotransferase family protein [Tepidisphaeraceae bacterium]
MPKKLQHPLYEEVANRIVAMIDSGTLAVGSRAPSVRALAEQMKVSISTVVSAYEFLERQGRLQARPQSGFYVRALRREDVEEPAMSQPSEAVTDVTVGDLRLLLLTEFGQPGIIGLGASNGAVSNWSIKSVHALMNSISRSQPLLSASYPPPAGMAVLRRQVARWYTRAGCTLAPDDVVITSGALEAIHLSLRTVTQPGDTVAIESPTYWGILQSLELLGLRDRNPDSPAHRPIARRARCRPFTEPREGRRADSDRSQSARLDHAGGKSRQVVAMTRRANVPLIEDEIYADLAFEPPRPRSCRSFDDGPSAQSHVMVCGGVSKTVCPSLRIGWCIPGKWVKERHTHQGVAEHRVAYVASTGTRAFSR